MAFVPWMFRLPGRAVANTIRARVPLRAMSTFANPDFGRYARPAFWEDTKQHWTQTFSKPKRREPGNKKYRNKWWQYAIHQEEVGMVYSAFLLSIGVVICALHLIFRPKHPMSVGRNKPPELWVHPEQVKNLFFYNTEQSHKVHPHQRPTKLFETESYVDEAQKYITDVFNIDLTVLPKKYTRPEGIPDRVKFLRELVSEGIETPSDNITEELAANLERLAVLEKELDAQD